MIKPQLTSTMIDRRGAPAAPMMLRGLLRQMFRKLRFQMIDDSLRSESAVRVIYDLFIPGNCDRIPHPCIGERLGLSDVFRSDIVVDLVVVPLRVEPVERADQCSRDQRFRP